MAMGSKITHKIGTWRAPIIYTPIEVAEAVFLQQAKKIRCKIGHMEETVYDKYIISVMDVVHLRQPTDFRSSRLKPRTVTPYIDKERREPNIRIYFDDTIDSIVEKIGSVPSDDYVFTIHPDAGEVLNPIIDKAVLAVESARCMNLGPIKLAGTTVSSGSHLIHAVAAREISVRDIAKDLPGVLFDNLVSPFTRTQEVRA